MCYIWFSLNNLLTLAISFSTVARVVVVVVVVVAVVIVVVVVVVVVVVAKLAIVSISHLISYIHLF